MTLKVGELLSGVTAITEEGDRLEADYAANDDDVVVPIQSDPPGPDQFGTVLDQATKRYIGLSGDHPSYGLASEACRNDAGQVAGVGVDPWCGGCKSNIRRVAPNADSG